jgi:hypothetical protein
MGSNARRGSLRFNLLQFYHGEYEAKKIRNSPD